MQSFEFVVEELKTRVDKVCSAHLEYLSRSQLQRLIQKVGVLVNGERVLNPATVVRKGDQIELVVPPKPGIMAKPMEIRTVFEGQGLLVVDKPAGMIVHPASGYKGDSLVSGVLYSHPDVAEVGEEDRPGIVHRLDKDTSGLLLVALTAEMHKYLKDAFAERRIKKHYTALVYGRFEESRGVIDTPIGKSRKDFRKMTTLDPLQSKEALTEYRVVEKLLFPNNHRRGDLDAACLLDVDLHTGRTHQIRVHLASIGHPVFGDVLYGNQDSLGFPMKRQFLHASSLSLNLPDGTTLELESPLPPDLQTVLDKLRKNHLD